MSSPLSKPWAENITTFADALNASLPHSARPLPSVMHVADRCWCDFSAGGFFEPFNVSHWEHISVDRFKVDLERRQETEENMKSEREQDLVDKTALSGLDAGNLATQTDSKMPRTAPPEVGGTIWSRLQIFRRKFDSPLPSVHIPLPESKPSHDLPSKPDIRQTAPYAAAQEGLPLLRKEYDLRLYGLDVVIDFGWTR